jgi:hypothetical protein
MANSALGPDAGCIGATVDIAPVAASRPTPRRGVYLEIALTIWSVLKRINFS